MMPSSALMTFSIHKIVYDFFFFSSRRRHTRYWRDWSSDVCSSDLGGAELGVLLGLQADRGQQGLGHAPVVDHLVGVGERGVRATGQQLGVAGSGADERDASCWLAGGAGGHSVPSLCMRSWPSPVRPSSGAGMCRSVQSLMRGLPYACAPGPRLRGRRLARACAARCSRSCEAFLMHALLALAGEAVVWRGHVPLGAVAHAVLPIRVSAPF